MTRPTFNATITPVLNARFRASSWARQSDKVKQNDYARWFICLIDKYSNHKVSFNEVVAAVEVEVSKFHLQGLYRQYSYFLALTQTPYYKYRIIHTKVKLCDDQTI